MRCPKCNSENVGVHDRNVSPHRTRMRCNDCKHRWNIPDDEVDSDTAKPQIGMSLEEFRDKHDVEFIITKTLTKLDKNMVYEKSDLVKMSGLPYSAQGLTAILESKKEYYGKISGKVYYSHPDTIKMLKEQAKLN